MAQTGRGSFIQRTHRVFDDYETLKDHYRFLGQKFAAEMKNSNVILPLGLDRDTSNGLYEFIENDGPKHVLSLLCSEMENVKLCKICLNLLIVTISMLRRQSSKNARDYHKIPVALRDYVTNWATTSMQRIAGTEALSICITLLTHSSVASIHELTFSLLAHLVAISNEAVRNLLHPPNYIEDEEEWITRPEKIQDDISKEIKAQRQRSPVKSPMISKKSPGKSVKSGKNMGNDSGDNRAYSPDRSQTSKHISIITTLSPRRPSNSYGNLDEAASSIGSIGSFGSSFNLQSKKETQDRRDAYRAPKMKGLATPIGRSYRQLPTHMLKTENEKSKRNLLPPIHQQKLQHQNTEQSSCLSYALSICAMFFNRFNAMSSLAEIIVSIVLDRGTEYALTVARTSTCKLPVAFHPDNEHLRILPRGPEFVRMLERHRTDKPKLSQHAVLRRVFQQRPTGDSHTHAGHGHAGVRKHDEHEISKMQSHARKDTKRHRSTNYEVGKWAGVKVLLRFLTRIEYYNGELLASMDQIDLQQIGRTLSLASNKTGDNDDLSIDSAFEVDFDDSDEEHSYSKNSAVQQPRPSRANLPRPSSIEASDMPVQKFQHVAMEVRHAHRECLRAVALMITKSSEVAEFVGQLPGAEESIRTAASRHSSNGEISNLAQRAFNCITYEKATFTRSDIKSLSPEEAAEVAETLGRLDNPYEMSQRQKFSPVVLDLEEKVSNYQAVRTKSVNPSELLGVQLSQDSLKSDRSSYIEKGIEGAKPPSSRMKEGIVFVPSQPSSRRTSSLITTEEAEKLRNITKYSSMRVSEKNNYAIDVNVDLASASENMDSPEMTDGLRRSEFIIQREDSSNRNSKRGSRRNSAITSRVGSAGAPSEAGRKGSRNPIEFTSGNAELDAMLGLTGLGGGGGGGGTAPVNPSAVATASKAGKSLTTLAPLIEMDSMKIIASEGSSKGSTLGYQDDEYEVSHWGGVDRTFSMAESTMSSVSTFLSSLPKPPTLPEIVGVSKKYDKYNRLPSRPQDPWSHTPTSAIQMDDFSSDEESSKKIRAQIMRKRRTKKDKKQATKLLRDIDRAVKKMAKTGNQIEGSEREPVMDRIIRDFNAARANFKPAPVSRPKMVVYGPSPRSKQSKASSRSRTKHAEGSIPPNVTVPGERVDWTSESSLYGLQLETSSAGPRVLDDANSDYEYDFAGAQSVAESSQSQDVLQLINSSHLSRDSQRARQILLAGGDGDDASAVSAVTDDAAYDSPSAEGSVLASPAVAAKQEEECEIDRLDSADALASNETEGVRASLPPTHFQSLNSGLLTSVGASEEDCYLVDDRFALAESILPELAKLPINFDTIDQLEQARTKQDTKKAAQARLRDSADTMTTVEGAPSPCGGSVDGALDGALDGAMDGGSSMSAEPAEGAGIGAVAIGANKVPLSVLIPSKKIASVGPFGTGTEMTVSTFNVHTQGAGTSAAGDAIETFHMSYSSTTKPGSAAGSSIRDKQK
jgi:hypothetical protein